MGRSIQSGESYNEHSSNKGKTYLVCSYGTVSTKLDSHDLPFNDIDKASELLDGSTPNISLGMDNDYQNLPETHQFRYEVKELEIRISPNQCHLPSKVSRIIGKLLNQYTILHEPIYKFESSEQDALHNLLILNDFNLTRVF